jgi:ornithine decarboxylase
LPANIAAGDYIEIGMIGAYGAAMRTSFNGFGDSDCYDVADAPMNSLYDGSIRTDWLPDNVVTLSR